MRENISIFDKTPKLKKTPIMLELKYVKEVLTIKFITRDLCKEIIKVEFDNILSYRDTNESFFLKTTAAIFDKEIKEEYKEAWIFQTQKSLFLDWIHEETFGVYKNFSIKHFIVFSSENVSEVISFDDPIITVE